MGNEEESNLNVQEKEQRGTFLVSLNSITLLNGDGDASKEPVTVEEAKVWALVTCTSDKEDSIWWNANAIAVNESEDHASEEAMVLEREKAYSPLVAFPTLLHSNSTSLEYAQSSKSFLLTPSTMHYMSKSIMTVSIFTGSSRTIEGDVLLGTVSIPLVSLLEETHVHQNFNMLKNEELNTNEYSVGIEMECDVDLADFILGGRTLSADGFTIGNVPTEWLPEVVEGETAQDVAEDITKNSAVYSLILELEGVEVALEAGKAVFTSTEQPKTVDPEVVEPTAEVTDEESTAPTTDGTWSITWPPASKLVQFLLGSSFNIQAENDDGIRCKIQRTDPGKITASAWSASCTVSCSALFAPGKAQATIQTPLQAGILSSRESLEEQLLDPSISKENKTLLQEKVSNYEEALTTCAGQAVIVASASTYLQTTLSVHKALVQRPVTPQVELPPISSLVPSRKALPKYPKKEASLAFQKEIKNIVVMILTEYETLFFTETENVEKNENMAFYPREERKKKLIYHLNTEGVYHDFKESLKRKIVAVVQERFPSAPSCKTGDETDSLFYSTLYAELMEQVHISLNSLFEGPKQMTALLQGNEQEATSTVIKSWQKDMDLYQVRAVECESTADFARAQEYHLSRIAVAEDHAVERGKYDAGVWYDFALFCFRRQDHEQASACLQQCLSIDSGHLPAAQAYGALCIEQRLFETAELLLKNTVKDELVSDTEPSALSELSHGLLAIYYHEAGQDTSGNMERVEWMTAKNKSDAKNKCVSISAIHVASYLIDLKLPLSTKVALDNIERNGIEYWSSSHRVCRRLVTAKLCMLHEHNEDAHRELSEAIEIDSSTADAWFLLAQMQHASGDTSAVLTSLSHARHHYENLDVTYQLTMYLQLGETLLHASQIEESKNVYLEASVRVPSASTWLGVGVACLRSEDWKGCEQALSEANMLDNTNATVWGYLSLLCLSVLPTRREEANLCLEQSLQHELKDANLLRELGNALMANDELEEAESLFRRSLSCRDSSSTRRRLADVLAARNCAKAALIEYRTYLTMDANVEDRPMLLEKCAQLLSTLGRSDEAEEYSTMAEKQKETERLKSSISTASPEDVDDEPLRSATTTSTAL